jgi:hypothetical protein
MSTWLGPTVPSLFQVILEDQALYLFRAGFFIFPHYAFGSSFCVITLVQCMLLLSLLSLQQQQP